MCEETIRFDKKAGKYRVGLPWKEGRKKAGQILQSVDSKAMATKRLKAMISRFHRDPVYLNTRHRPGLAPKSKCFSVATSKIALPDRQMTATSRYLKNSSFKFWKMA